MIWLVWKEDVYAPFGHDPPGVLLAVYNNPAAAELHRADLTDGWVTEHVLKDDYHQPPPITHDGERKSGAKAQ